MRTIELAIIDQPRIWLDDNEWVMVRKAARTSHFDTGAHPTALKGMYQTPANSRRDAAPTWHSSCYLLKQLKQRYENGNNQFMIALVRQ